MFALADQGKQEILNVIIIRLKGFQLGIVVDSINKVIGISSENIQPPPALFSDINIKYLSGVVENDNKLYLILDVDKIFYNDDSTHYENQIKRAAFKQKKDKNTKDALHEFNFIVETLATFKRFYVTEINREWVEQRFKEWKELRSSQGEDFQLTNENEADQFLTNFYSACTGRLFSGDLKRKIISILPDNLNGTINAWNTGCSRGHEAYSLATLFKLKYPKEILKIWANDNDLINVSNAPNLVFKEIEIPDYLKKSDLMEPGANGFKFKKELKDLIYFEFHDTLNTSAMPDIDLIVARDILSFQTPANQKKMLDEFDDKLKAEGLLIIGDNEYLDSPHWIHLNNDGLNVYKKEKG
jgi:purine-binding chemotaxis protein CheW